jgi:hypothetical protein
MLTEQSTSKQAGNLKSFPVCSLTGSCRMLLLVEAATLRLNMTQSGTRSTRLNGYQTLSATMPALRVVAYTTQHR